MENNSSTHTGPSRGLPTWREVAVLAAILLVGAFLRFAYLRELVTDPFFAQPAFDADYHDYWAWGMASGDWSRPMGLEDPRIAESPFFRPPAYPYFLAAVYRIAGHHYVVPRLVQFVMGLASCVLGYWIGRRMFGGAVGLILSALLAVHWVFIFFEGELLAPALLVLLALGMFLSLASLIRRPGAWRGAAAGVLLGLFALARPNVLLFAPAAVGWLLWLGHRRRVARPYLLAGIGFALAAVMTILPATIRNYRVSGEWVPITSNGGINLYIGNNPAADGTNPAIPQVEELTGRVGWTCFDYPNVVRGLEKEIGRPLTYGEASSYWATRALRYIREHPREFLRLTVKRAALFWGPSEVGNNKDVHFARESSRVLRRIPIDFPLVLSMALTGCVLLVVDLRRRRTPPGSALPSGEQVEWIVLAGAFVVLYFASFVFFFFAARYRVPILPFLLLVGAYALYRVGALLAHRRVVGVVACVALCASFYAAARVNWAGFEPRRDEWHFALGSAYGQQGRTRLAIEEYRKALAIDPTHSVAHNNLGLALLKEGQPDEAVAHLRRALELNPGDPNAHFNLGGLLLRLNRPHEAIEEYLRGLERSPEDAFAHVNVGAALFVLDDPEAALAHFDEARRIRPDLPQGHLNAGRALLEVGRLEEAVEALETALAMQPSNASAHYYLGLASERRGDLGEAVRHYRAALAIRPGYPEVEERLEAVSSGARP